MISSLQRLHSSLTLFLLSSSLLLAPTTHAWVSRTTPTTTTSITSRLFSATTLNDDEYEYVEYDALREDDFCGSEWLVGTQLDRNPNKIDETWCRLAVTADGKNLAVWGDKSEGTWALDVASQFLSVSKENLLGKQIWAGVVDDYYYLQGTVRGWTYWSAASVVGQWQAKRLGVEPDEAGPAPWFEADDESAVSSE